MSRPKVFIAHSHEDREWVREFAEALESEGISVWLDELSLRPGEPLRKALETGLRESNAIVAMVTSRNVARPNLFFELGVALGMGKLLIPVLSPDVENSLVPFDLRARRYLTRGRADLTAREVAVAVKEQTKQNVSNGAAVEG